MKILYLHQHFSTPLGSTGTRSYEFSKALIKAGHEVTMICGSYWIADSGLKGSYHNGVRKGLVDGINVIQLQLSYSNSDNYLSRTASFLKYSFQGVRYALSLEYDLIFATSTPLTAGIPGIFAKLIRNKKFIFEVRDLWPELPKAMGVIKNPVILKLMDLLETLTYLYSDKCVALAPGIAEGIKNKFPSKEVTIIPNGSDDYCLKTVKTNVSGKLVAAFTGAHGMANGLNSLLDVAQELLAMEESGIEIQFIGDGKLKQGLIARVERDSLTNCRFLDPMPKTDLFDYLNKTVHVGLMVLDNIPAFYNGTSPNKFFDYLSLGLPVINNYPGWLAELIRDSKCGLVVNPGDAKQFAKALVSLKENPSLCAELGSNAMSLSQSKFKRSSLAYKFVQYMIAS